MKSMSVFQVVLLASFGALAIAAVLIFALAVGGGNSSSVGAVRIWGTVDQAAFTTVLRQFAENNPDLSQVAYEQHDVATYQSDLLNALASGQGPDLFLMPQEYAYSQAQKVVPLPATAISDTQFQNAFVDGASPFLSQSGALAVPLLVDPLVLYWNKDMLSAAGYARAPQFWDELLDMVRAVTQRTDTGSVVKSALAFGEFRNIPDAKDILAMLIMQAGGSITARDQAGNLVTALSPRTGETTQSTVSALRFYTKYADPSMPDYTWNRSLQDARKAFAAGDLALYVGYASEEPILMRMNPNLNFAVAAVPQIRGASRYVVAGRVYALAIPRTSKNSQGAMTVAFDIGASDFAKALSKAIGIPSARRDVLSQPADGNDNLYNKQAIIVRSWIDPDPVKTSSIFQDMIENTVSGATLVTEAVTRADQEMAHLLGQ